MSRAQEWADGYACAAWLLGARGDELASGLPERAPLPAWVDALSRQPDRETRAAILAPHLVRLNSAVDAMRPGRFDRR